METSSTICKIIGHRLSRHETTGISPRLLKVMHRIVYVCDRRGCSFREQHDAVTSNFDIKNGVNLWGSGGVCMGCKKAQTCESTSDRIMLGTKHAYIVLGGFTYPHCPIKEFEIKDEEKQRLEQTGDMLID